MADLIVIDDFVGVFELPKTQFNSDKLTSIIDDVETEMLIKLLGLDLYTLFIADIDTVTKKPVTAKYLSIYNQIVSYNFYGETLYSKGMKEALKCFIYFEYSTKNIVNVTPVANSSSKNGESSKNQMNSNYFATFYNKGIDYFKAIQQYISDNSADYPTYVHSEFNYEYFL